MSSFIIAASFAFKQNKQHENKRISEFCLRVMNRTSNKITLCSGCDRFRHNVVSHSVHSCLLLTQSFLFVHLSSRPHFFYSCSMRRVRGWIAQLQLDPLWNDQMESPLSVFTEGIRFVFYNNRCFGWWFLPQFPLCHNKVNHDFHICLKYFDEAGHGTAVSKWKTNVNMVAWHKTGVSN